MQSRRRPALTSEMLASAGWAASEVVASLSYFNSNVFLPLTFLDAGRSSYDPLLFLLLFSCGVIDGLRSA